MARNPIRGPEPDDLHDVQAGGNLAASSLTRTFIHTAGFLLVIVSLLMFAGSILQRPAGFELWAVDLVRSLDFGFAATALNFLSHSSSLYAILAIWILLLSVSVVRRRWGSAVGAALLPVVIGAAVITDRFITTRGNPELPPIDLVGGSISSPAFASLQIISVLLIFGLLFFLARHIQQAFLRILVSAVSVAAIVTTGLSQLLLGTAWPLEILSGYVVGSLALIPILFIVYRVNLACANLPAIQAADVPLDANQRHAQALTSTVVFNESTVSKIYRPGFLPRAIYWIAFQAEFPYMRNQHALRAAVNRRNLIGQLTEFWYGSNLVAKAIGVDEIAGRYAITSEFIDGTEPRNREQAKEFLRGLVANFEAAGLPTWQIDPRQPRSTDNVLETPDGRYHVVDLESGLVAPLASIQTWRRAFKRGLVPLYDDVFFDVTRAYVANHEAQMRSQMGSDWVDRLMTTLDATERDTNAWHGSEPRIWSRLFGRRRHSDNRAQQRQHWAIQWFEEAIGNWRTEGRITSSDARKLQSKVRSSQFVSVMPHFGVHLGTTLLLRFPLGSIARASYSTFMLLNETWKFASRRTDRRAWREALGVHSPLVILISAIPGVGAFAYLASRPIRTDHRLLCIGLDAVLLKFPWRIYERSGARWLITQMPEFAERMTLAPQREMQMAPQFAWSHEHRSAERLDRSPYTADLVEGVGVRSIV
jgi:hypothetical protein